ncbi:MAG TPA: CU044_2847 family protein [Pseudolabrys sp.]|nr:CU044_2847 family protein [Pseudolabrys sp.]
MAAHIKVNLGNSNGTIWVEAVDVVADRPQGRNSVSAGTEVVANLANAFDQFRCVFEIAQTQLTKMQETADETTLELSAKLTTNGNLLIVQGSAEGAIKVTMKWKKPAGETKAA